MDVPRAGGRPEGACATTRAVLRREGAPAVTGPVVGATPGALLQMAGVRDGAVTTAGVGPPTPRRIAAGPFAGRAAVVPVVVVRPPAAPGTQLRRRPTPPSRRAIAGLLPDTVATYATEASVALVPPEPAPLEPATVATRAIASLAPLVARPA